MSRDPEIVSKNMQKIHSKDTSIELQLRKALWHKGYRYRKNYKFLPGSPDIVLTKYKIAIFCDSEFFHGKNWEILKLRLEKGKKSRLLDQKKLNVIVPVILKLMKKLLFLGYTVIHFLGTRHRKNIQMNAFKPLKKLYGIVLFPITLLKFQMNSIKFVAVFFDNTATNFLYIYNLFLHTLPRTRLHIIHSSYPFHLIFCL